MNIAISTLVNSASENGLTQYIRNLINEFEKIDDEHSYYVIINKELKQFYNFSNSRLNYLLVEIPHNPRFIMRPFYFIWQNYFARELFDRYNIDVIHYPNPIPLFVKNDIPTVTTIHDVAEFRGYRHNNLYAWFRRFVTKTAVNKSDLILTVSEFSKNEILELMEINSSKVIVTKLGTNINKYSHLNSISSDKPYVLHVGGSSQHKNLDRLIKGFQRSNFSKIGSLMIIGNIELPEMTRSLNKPNIIVTGSVNEKDLVLYYKNALSLVYPSLYEGFGLPIIEAMALGVPVITSFSGAMKEIAGEAALFVNPYSVDEISAAIDKMYSQESVKTKLIERGLKQSKLFNSNLSSRLTIKSYEKAYHSFNLEE